VAELERQLRQLGREVEYPPTPPLAQAVARDLEGSAGAGQPRRPVWRPLSARIATLAVALLLLLAGAVLAAVPATRHALLDLVGLRGATVERVPSLSPGIRPQPGLGLGRASTLESARHSLSFEPLLPTGLGPPDGVFVLADHPPPGGELSLTYPPQPGLPQSRLTGVGLLLNEIHGTFAPGFFGKLTPRGVIIQRLHVAGHAAIWVKGLHEFFYKSYSYRLERTRLAANTLLVQHGPVLVRIEGKFGLEKALAIARSLRPG
jgi:hypothetical protein